MKNFSLTLLVCAISISMTFAQNTNETDSASIKNSQQDVQYKHSIGASLWMMMNFFPESGDYGLLTYGYQLTEKDRIFVEYNTWKYAEPMGTYGHSKEMYPGYIRTHGIGMGYQRFLWKGLFTTAQATNFMKQYHDENDEKTQKGYQLYLQLALGYRLELFKKRWYVEPSYALKLWPIDTNIPDDFAQIAKGTQKYFFEFGLNFGYKF